MVTVAVPLTLGAGVNESVPAELTSGATRNKAASCVWTEKLRCWLVSSGPPATISAAQPGMARGPLSSVALGSGPTVKLGASFTAEIVIETVAGLEAMPAALAV